MREIGASKDEPTISFATLFSDVGSGELSRKRFFDGDTADLADLDDLVDLADRE